MQFGYRKVSRKWLFTISYDGFPVFSNRQHMFQSHIGCSILELSGANLLRYRRPDTNDVAHGITQVFHLELWMADTRVASAV